MRITKQMIDAFEMNADIVVKDNGGSLEQEITDGLKAAAPWIAEQAMPGFIEIGTQLKLAHNLLTRAGSALDGNHRYHRLHEAIEEFLA